MIMVIMVVLLYCVRVAMQQLASRHKESMTNDWQYFLDSVYMHNNISTLYDLNENARR